VFQIQLQAKQIKSTELEYLLRRPVITGVVSPFKFISSNIWGAVKSLVLVDDEFMYDELVGYYTNSDILNYDNVRYFRSLDKDIENSGKRWQLYVDSETPENEKLPQDWKNKTPMQKLCIIRALRTDRMTYATKIYVHDILGAKYTNFRPPMFSESFKETTSKTPIFFILSSGVDPTRVNNLS